MLDLGCGSGRDVYIAAALVGESGSVVGVDMTEQQLETATTHAHAYATATLGYAKSNMTFLKGYIEDLGALGLAPASIDLAISNCVVNLSSDKHAVLASLFTILSPGGEFHFSDVFSDVDLPEDVRTHKVLVGECLGGAVTEAFFADAAMRAGFAQPLQVTKREIEVHDPELKALLGAARFYSVTYRLFKLKPPSSTPGHPKPSEGAVVRYMGGYEGQEEEYTLAEGVVFPKGKFKGTWKGVRSGDVAAILHRTWLSKYFEVFADSLFDPERPQPEGPVGLPPLKGERPSEKAPCKAEEGAGKKCCG